MTTTTNRKITCPAWCTEPDPAQHDVDFDGSALHPGPTFGFLRFRGITEAGGEIRELMGEFVATAVEMDFANPEQLRELALDAVAAAKWLEEQRAARTMSFEAAVREAANRLGVDLPAGELYTAAFADACFTVDVSPEKVASLAYEIRAAEAQR